MTVRVEHGDCLNVMRQLIDEGVLVDSTVCDPPYHLASIVERFSADGAAGAKSNGATGVYKRSSQGFMGQTWDGGDIAFRPETWQLVFELMKPGAYLIAFSHPKNYHRMACAIEDAGFEIRDMINWLFGTGFPKSLDISKAIDKRRTEDIEPTRRVCRFLRAAMQVRGLKSSDLTVHFNDCTPRLIDHWAARDTDGQPSLPTPEQWFVLKSVLALPDEMDAEVARLNARKNTFGEDWQNAQVVGEHHRDPGGFGHLRFNARDTTIRRHNSPAAEEWAGWGTALKPAMEPICLARKPLSEGTVIDNVLKHSTGGINIAASGVPFVSDEDKAEASAKNQHSDFGGQPMSNKIYGDYDQPRDNYSAEYRWPANVMHDGSDEVRDAFPDGTSRFFYSAKAQNDGRILRCQICDIRARGKPDCCLPGREHQGEDIGHPTVKPIPLMEWLVTLVTPKKGLVLDPFAGTGTTAEAAMRKGFDALLIEKEEPHIRDIEFRLASLRGGDLPIFSGL
jgi:DNA modification methylase